MSALLQNYFRIYLQSVLFALTITLECEKFNDNYHFFATVHTKYNFFAMHRIFTKYHFIFQIYLNDIAHENTPQNAIKSLLNLLV